MSEVCTICGGALKERFRDVRDPITRERFSVFACPSCHTGYTEPRPAAMENYYPSAYYGGRHGATLRFCIARRLRLLASACSDLRMTDPALLDIGCGDGSFLLAAKARGWRVTGVERFAEEARRQGIEVVEELDALEVGRYDCVTLWHSLEHIPEPMAMVRRIVALLKPGGVVIIAVPDNGGWQARLFGRYWLHLDVPRHLLHFSRESLVGLLERAGFSIRHTGHQEFEYDLLGWSQSALNALFETPNIFFDWLTKKPVRMGKGMLALQLALGAGLTALAIPLVWLGALCRRGGTVVVVGGRRGVGLRGLGDGEDRRGVTW